MRAEPRTPLVGSVSTQTRACALIFVMLHAGTGPCPAGDFASIVLDYSPAPGQFVNNTLFNDPTKALGPPIGGGTAAPDNTKVVTLGGFGGSITLGFGETVWDDPCNPFGLDVIVFGNGLWRPVSGQLNANRRFGEAGIIEISLDVNGNGLPDDPWYIIPGSSLPNASPAAVPADSIQFQDWDSDPASPTPPSNAGWYPAGAPSQMMTGGYRLPSEFEVALLDNPNGLSADFEGHFGYADLSPVAVLGDLTGDNIVDVPGMEPAEFYTRPDNPFRVGLTPGSAGGDAFDIAWAVDPVTGERANLPGFDFIRISTGVNFIAGVLGELSTEVSGVARVRPDVLFFDLNGDGCANLEDLYTFHSLGSDPENGADLTGEGTVDHADVALLHRCLRRFEPTDIAGDAAR